MPLCPTIAGVLHLWSAHSGTYDYNNDNYGSGVECENRLFHANAGVYENSYSKTSSYVSIGKRTNTIIAIGANLGYVTGYEQTKLLATGEISIPVARNLNASILIAPPIGSLDGFFHLTFRYSFFPRG